MTDGLVLALYSALVVLASLGGGFVPNLVRLSHVRVQLMMSFVAGFMLGVGVLHLLPHAMAEIGHVDTVASWCLAGMLVTFVLIRAFHAEPEAMEGAMGPGDPGHVHGHGAPHEHARAHEHAHEHAHPHGRTPHAGRSPAPGSGVGRFAWVGVALGMGLHSLIDGVALGAGIRLASEHGDAGLVAMGTFLAIFLHKPLDALAVTSVMCAAGWTARVRTAVNVGFALLCPIGAAAIYVGAGALTTDPHAFTGVALAFAAGVFVCLSLSDLLPEVRFHAHDRLPLSVALALGLAASIAIGLIEPEHAHEPVDHPASEHAGG